MANFYYVRDDGTAPSSLAPFGSKQTGTMTALGVANIFPNIAAAIGADTPPVAVDFILVSDIHNYTQASAITYTGIAVTPFYIVCVSDVAIDAGRRTGNRGFEGTSVSADITYTHLYVSGIEFNALDDSLFAGGNLFSDTKIKSTEANDLSINFGADGSSIFLENSEIALDNIASRLTVSNGGVINMIGGAVTTITAGVTSLFQVGFTSGGGQIRFSGVDISAITGTIIADVGSSVTADDVIDVHFDMCKTANGVDFTNEVFKSKDQRALFTRCSDDSATAEYQYHLHAFGGDVDDDSVIFRNEDEAFTESNQKISYKIVTNSDASLGSPLWFDFPVLRYSRLSAGVTDTLRFFITSNTVLTDKDIYLNISYPDGTNKQTPNFLTSAPVNIGGTIDLMATGTTLTTDGSSSWTGALSNLYQIDIDTSSDAGADCQPIVRVYVTLPSVTIQIASEFGLS